MRATDEAEFKRDQDRGSGQLGSTRRSGSKRHSSPRRTRRSSVDLALSLLLQNRRGKHRVFLACGAQLR